MAFPPRPIEPCAEHCPDRIREALDLVAAKWTVPLFILLHEAREPVRYAAIEKSLAGITPKELAKNLRKLESAGLVSRTVHPTSPPAVNYALSALGESLYPSLQGLAHWAAMFGDEVERHQSQSRPSERKLVPYAGRR